MLLSLPLYPSYLLVIILLFFYSTMNIEQQRSRVAKEGTHFKSVLHHSTN